jgi:hypothetical protein
MASSIIDIILFAPIAPILGVLLFWFIQLLFIESHKYLLSKIWERHKPLCRFTNFLGVLFQTICHALGYTVTRSGISQFEVTVDYGKVSPKKEKGGFFEWLSNVFLLIGPFFIPPLIILILFYFLVDGLEFTIPNIINLQQDLYYSFAGQMNVFGHNLFYFSEKFLNFLINIDLLHPANIGFALLLIFLGMGIRPSYIGKEKQEKVNMIYDLNNIKDYILKKPIYLILIVLFSYLLFYLFFVLSKQWYHILFSIFGWLSITAIFSLIFTETIILLVKITDEIPSPWKYLPYLNIPTSYILMRVFFLIIFTNFAKQGSLVIMILSTVVMIFLLLKFKTNKFKTKTNMKQLNKKTEFEEDESGRNVG